MNGRDVPRVILKCASSAKPLGLLGDGAHRIVLGIVTA